MQRGFRGLAQMGELLSVAGDNLLSPPFLFFVLGMAPGFCAPI